MLLAEADASFVTTFFRGTVACPPRVRRHAASARIGLSSSVDWTQDVVPERSQDYARRLRVSRICPFFFLSIYMLIFNELPIISQQTR